MDPKLVGRLSDFAPPWLRYMLTLSEAARTGQSWVVASGEDIGLWDTDAGAVLPLWPTELLARQSVSDTDGEATAVPLAEITERLLPYLIEADASLSLFPNFEDDMLVEPDAIAEDLADFAAEPIDIAAELTIEPVDEAYDEWALLESPEIEDEEEGWAPEEVTPQPTAERYSTLLAAAAATGALWLLDDPAEDAVVGIVLADRPGVALFPSSAAAMEYAGHVGGDISARPVSVDALVGGWMLVAYGGHWAVAISPDAETATFVEPTRFALDLAEACGAEKP